MACLLLFRLGNVIKFEQTINIREGRIFHIQHFFLCTVSCSIGNCELMAIFAWTVVQKNRGLCHRKGITAICSHVALQLLRVCQELHSLTASQYYQPCQQKAQLLLFKAFFYSVLTFFFLFCNKYTISHQTKDSLKYLFRLLKR